MDSQTKILIVCLIIAGCLGGGLFYFQHYRNLSAVAPVGSSSGVVDSNGTGIPGSSHPPKIISAPEEGTWTLVKKMVSPDRITPPIQPVTNIMLTLETTRYTIGTFQGDCMQILDKSLFKDGEISGIQCMWKGAGKEFGLFKENATYSIKTVGLSGIGNTVTRTGSFAVLLDALSKDNGRPESPTIE